MAHLLSYPWIGFGRPIKAKGIPVIWFRIPWPANDLRFHLLKSIAFRENIRPLAVFQTNKRIFVKEHRKMMSVAEVTMVLVLCPLAAVAICFCLYRKFVTFRSRWTSKVDESLRFRREEMETHEELWKLGRNVKALIGDGDGVEVLYLRKLEDGQPGTGFPKFVLNSGYGEDLCSEEEKRMDGSMERSKGTASREAPLLQEPVPAYRIPFPEQPLPPPLPPSLPPMASAIIPAKQTPPPVPAIGIPTLEQPLPHPPLAPTLPPTVRSPANHTQPPPPPPPPPPMRASIQVRRTSRSTGVGISALQSKSQGRSIRSTAYDSMPTEQTSKTDSHGPRKLKPLHWDKITATNAEHSVVWDEINNGSLW